MIKANRVRVLRRCEAGVDSLGAQSWEWIAEDSTVGVIVEPIDTSNLGENRPESVKVTYKFHFPKTYTTSLKGCRIEFRGRLYNVVGDPQSYPPRNCPGKYNRPVKAVVVDG